MPTIRAGDRLPLGLDPGKVLTVTADSISSAIVRTFASNTQGLQSNGQITIATGQAQSFGPYLVGQRFVVEGVTGSVNYSLDDAAPRSSLDKPVTFNQATGTIEDTNGSPASGAGSSAPIQRPYRFTAYGDSRAAFMSTSTLLAVTGSATGLNSSRVLTWLVGFLGDAEAVANYGVSGDAAVNWASSSRANSKTINNLAASALFKGGPCDAVYVQYGINDYIAGTSAAVVAAAIQAACTALMGAGMKVVLEATNPASAASYGASAAAKLQATIDGNAILKAWAAGYPRQLVFVDTFASLIDGTGYANDAYFADGLHFNPIGAMLSGAACAAAARTLLVQKRGMVYTSGSLLQPNLIDWSSTPTMYAVTDFGTVTRSTPTWNIDPAVGLPYAEVTLTCTALSGGRALAHLEISATPVTGATPRYPISIGNELQGSAIIVVDDGAGGIAPIQAAMLRMRAYFDSKYADAGAFIGAAGANYQQVFAARLTTPTIVTATSSGAIVNTSAGGLQLQPHVEFNAVGQSARLRVYAPSIRVVSSGIQPSQPAAGASPYTYTNSTGAPLMLYVAGGTVSAISLARQGSALATGLTSGAFYLAQNDSATITYTVAPTLTVQPVEQR